MDPFTSLPFVDTARSPYSGEHVYWLPSEDIIREFYNNVTPAQHAPYEINALISSAVEAIEYRDHCRLPETAEAVYDNYYSQTLGDALSAKIVSAAWLTLAMKLYDLYSQFNLWNEKGRFPYFYKGCMGYDIVVERIPGDWSQPVIESPADIENRRIRTELWRLSRNGIDHFRNGGA